MGMSAAYLEWVRERNKVRMAKCACGAVAVDIRCEGPYIYPACEKHV